MEDYIASDYVAHDYVMGRSAAKTENSFVLFPHTDFALNPPYVDLDYVAYDYATIGIWPVKPVVNQTVFTETEQSWLTDLPKRSSTALSRPHEVFAIRRKKVN